MHTIFCSNFLLELEVVYSSWSKCYEVLSLKINSESPKRCFTWWEIQEIHSKEGKWKTKSIRKFNNVTTTIKFFTFLWICKRIYFAWIHSLGKCSLYYYISSNFFLVLQDTWSEVMKHQRPYKSALVVQNSILPKCLATYFDIGFDSDGFFFQMPENYLENSKCIGQRNL